MSLENVKLGDLSAKRVERIIDDTAERFGKLCAECFRKAAMEIARPDMEVKTLVMRSVALAVSNKGKPLDSVKEEQDESDPVAEPEDMSPKDHFPEPSFAVYLKDEGDMDADAST
jgi:hypothetical protein